MAYKRLFTEEMLHVSGPWVDPKSDAHKALLACPETAPLVPRMKSVHQDLHDASRPSAGENPRIAEISARQEPLDVRHDDIVRGVFMCLTGMAYLLGMEGEGAELIKLRDELLPSGLETVNKPYHGEAGLLAQLEKRLTPELKASLDAILVGDKADKRTLGKLVAEWIGVGKELGTLEDEKDRLAAAPSESTGTELVKGRNQWIRVTTALVANAEMAQIEPAVLAVVFGPLWAAEKAADRRGGARKDKAKDGGDTKTPREGGGSDK